MFPFSRMVLSSAVLLTSTLAVAASPHVRRGPTAPRLARSHATRSSNRPSAIRGIDTERAAQIQTALIKAGYLNGTPSGTWDAQSEAAMEKLQADNGWQTKLVPDSRAIIKLGLGPKSVGESAEASAIAPDAPSTHTTNQ